MAKSALNIHIYPSSFKFESRIVKETRSIIEMGLAENVVILAIGERGQKQVEQLNGRIVVRRFFSLFNGFNNSKSLLAFKYFEFYLSTIIWMMFKKNITAINCHSLMVLPLGVFMKAIRRKIRVIYDAHELETERNGLAGFAKTISKKMERSLILKCDTIIVVGKRIKEWYEAEYSLENVFLVRNAPRRSGGEDTKSNLLRKQFNISEQVLVFIYQGMLIPGRGLDILVDVFKSLGSSHHLVVMGYGELEKSMQEIAERIPNIHFHPAVPPHEIMQYTGSCDIGISLIENTSLSYYYSLPNKLFEYLHAGLPVVVSAFPEMESLIREYNVGWAVNPTKRDLETLIRKIRQEDLDSLRKYVCAAAEILNWENEEAQLKLAFTS